MPAITLKSILKESMFSSRKAPTCFSWTAQNGAKKHGKTITELQAAGIEVGVIWQDGVAFHGPCHIRMNLALPLSRVKEAFDRLDKYVFNLQEA